MGATLLVCLLLAVGTLGGPINNKVERPETTCARHCKTNTKFFYKPRTTYRFDYVVDTKTSIEGASEDHALLQLRAVADVEVLSPCDFSLKLSNVQLFESDPNQPSRLINADPRREFQSALEKNPLRFSFQDGEVEELCHDESDPVWVMNIKRGVLSAFQNKMDSFEHDQKTKEVDVAGRCDVEYRKGASSWGTITIEKKKHLLGCDERHGYQSALQSSTYKAPSEIQSLPLMKSTHNCEQVITKSGQLQSSSCHEQHVFRPFSQGPNGAVTETKQELKFKQEMNGFSRPEKIKQRSSLLFEHNNGVNQENRRSEIISKLDEICRNTMNGIQTDTPRLFTDLVYLMKAANELTLQHVAAQIERGTICRANQDKIRKFYMDAIPMVGTESSVSVMADNIVKDKVTGAEAAMWLTSLAFIQNPTSNMLRQAKRMLKVSDTAMLSVSSLVNNFCQKNSCENNNEVEHIVATLEKMIGSTCYVTDDNLQKVLVSLRSIGNIGYAKSALTTINNCLSRKDNPMVARVAAAESFRRMPCDHDRDSLVKIFTKRDEDSELRINAYLGMMKCPSEHIINVVRRTLESEDVNQLGSFVWSHLTNLMETSDPHLQSVRSILNDEHLRKEFNVDKRKFSRNYEGSFHFDRLNTGARVDSNIIWSSRSFIPRSGMLNVTVNLFGKAVNLFEVGGRVQGLEYFLESYFGPNGYFKDQKEPAKFNQKAISNLSGDKIDKMKNNFEKKMEELRGDVYLRIFGNELFYKDVNGIENLLENNLNVLDLIQQLQKEQKYHYSQSMMFMDSSMIVPTAAGLPLNLTVNGTATVELEASGKVQLKNLLSTPTVDVDGFIRPSGAVEISGLMAVDAFTTKNGLKMVSTTHSRSLLKGHIKMANGEVFSSEWEVPDKEMDIFSFKTAFFTVHKNVEREQKMITDNAREHRHCTSDKLATITGLQLCGHIQYPNASLQVNSPYFPLTGPVNVGITLHKRDEHTSFKLQSKLLKTNDEYIASVNFDTPGARKVDRAMGLEAIVKPKESSLEVAMHSPWKKAKFSGSTTSSSKAFKLQGKLQVDNAKEYSMIYEVKKERNRAYTRFVPRLEINMPKQDPIILEEDLLMKGRRVESVFTATGLTKHPVSVKATYSNTNTEKGITGSLTYNKDKEYYIVMRLVQNYSKKKVAFSYAPVLIIRVPDEKTGSKEIVNMDGSLKYAEGKLLNFALKIDKILKNPIILKGQITKTYYAKRNRYLYRHRINVQAPGFKGSLRGQLDNRDYKNLLYKTTLDYNARGLKRNRVMFNGKVLNKSNKNLLKGALNGIFTMSQFPEYNVNLQSRISHNKRYSEATSELKYGNSKPAKSINFHVKSKHIISKKNDDNINLDALFKHPGMNINWYLKGNYQNDGENIESSGKLGYAKNKVISGNMDWINNKKRNLKAATFDLEYPGGKVLLKNTLIHKNDTYIHKLTTLLPKIGRSKIESSLSILKRRNYNFNTDMDIPYLRPIHLDGNLKMDPKDFNSATTVKYGKQAFTLKGKYKQTGNSHDGEIHVINPSRHIKASMSADKNSDKYTGNADILWDADNDKSKQASIGVNSVYKPQKKIDSTLKLKYPSRTININLKHNLGPKMSSHLETEWSPKDKAVLDVTFSRKSSRQVEAMDGSLNLLTPFTENINGDFTIRSDRSELSSVGKISWAKDKTISSKILIKKPVSWKRIRGTFKVNTPFEGIEKIEADIKHRADQALSSTLKTAVGNREVEIVLSGSKGDGTKREINGQIEIHSNIKPLKTLIIKAEHKDDGSVYHNNMMIRYNAKKYSYDLDMKHNVNGQNIHNKGELQVAVPGQIYKTEWKHRHNPEEIATTVSHGSKKNKWVELEVSGHHRVTDQRHLAGTVNLKTVSKKLHNINLNFDNKIGNSFMQNTATLRNNNRKVFFVENNLSKSDRGVSTNFNMHTSLTEKKMNIKMETDAQYKQYPVSGHIQFQWSPSDRIIMDSSFSKHDDGQLNGNIRFSSPFKMAKLFSFTTIRQKENNKWETISTAVIAPKKEIELRLTHPTENMRNMDVRLTTPFENWRRLHASYNNEGEWDDMITDASFKFVPHVKLININTAWNLKNGVKANTMITTPFVTLPKLGASLNLQHAGNQKQMDAKIEYKKNKEIIIRGLANVDRLNNINTELEVTTPFKQLERMKLLVNHNGGLRQFKSNVGLEISNQKNSDLEITYNALNGLRIGVITSSPLYKDVNVQINHERTHSSMNGDATVSYDRRPVVVGKINLASEPKYSAEFGMKNTLLDGFRDFEVIADHQVNSPSNFVSSGKLTLNGRQSFATANINMENGVISTLEVNTPGHKFDISLNHNGNLNNFNTKASAEYNTKKIQTELVFRSNPEVSVILNLQTPFEKLSDIQSSVNVNARERHYQTNGELRLNGDVSTGHVNINLNRGLNGRLVIRTPYRAARKLALNVVHEGIIDNFKTELSATLNRKSLKGDITFSLRPDLTLLVTADTPFSIIRSVNGQYTLSGDWKNFANKFELNWNGDQMSGDLSLQSRNGMEGKLNIKSPYEAVRNLDILISHQGSLDDFKTELAATHNTKSLKGEVAFQLNPSLILTLSADTPFTVIRNVHGQYKLSGNLRNFDKRIELNLNGDQMSGDMSLRSHNGIDGRLTIKSPYEAIRNLEIVTNHQGTMDDFKTEMAATYNRKSVKGDIAFRLTPDLVLTISAETPFTLIRNINGQYTLTGDLRNLQNRIELNLNGEQMSADMNLQSANGLDGKLSVKTPYDLLRNLDLVLNHKGSINDFQTTSSGSYNGQDVSGEISFKNLDSPIIIIDIVTPFENVRNFHSKLTHYGSASNFRTQGEYSLNHRRATADLTFGMGDEISGRLNIETPHSIRHINSEFRHKWTQSELESFASLNVNGQETQGNIKFVTQPAISGSINIQTPLEEFREMTATFSHDGSLRKFETHGDISVNGHKVGADLTVNTYGKFDSALSITTPRTTGKMTAIVTGELSDFQSQVIMSCFDYRLMATTSFVSKRFITELHTKLATSFNTVKEVNIDLIHKGDAHRFNTKLESNFNDEAINGAFSFNSKDVIDISANLNTPYTEDMKLQFSLSGERSNFRGNGIIQFGQKSGSIDLSFSSSPNYEGSVTMRLPLPNYKDTKMSFNVDTRGKKKGFESTLEFGNGKKINLESNIDISNGLTGSVLLKSPYTRTVRGSIDHAGSMLNFQSRLSASHGQNMLEINGNLNAEQDINGELEVSMQRKTILKLTFFNQGELKDFTTKIEGLFFAHAFEQNLRFQLGTRSTLIFSQISSLHKPLKITLENNLSSQEIQTTAAVMYGGNTVSLDATTNRNPYGKGSITLITPFKGYETTSAVYTINLADKNALLNGYVLYQNGKKIDVNAQFDTRNGHTGSFRLSSPYHKDIKLYGKHQGQIDNFQHRLELGYGGDNIEMEASFSQNKNIEGKLLLNAWSKNFVNAAFNLNGKPDNFNGHFEMTLFDQYSEADMKFNIIDDILAELNVKTPLRAYRNMRILYYHKGQLNDFSCHAEFVLNSQPYEGDLSFKKDQKIEGSITVKTPLPGFDISSLNFNHQGTPSNFDNTIHLTMKGEQYKLASVFSVDEGVNGEITFNSPFENFENFHFVLHHTLNIYNGMYNHIEVEYNTNDKIELDMDVTWKDKPQVRMTLNTPFEGFETNSLELSSSGDSKNLRILIRAEMMNQEMRTDIVFNNDKSKDGSLKIKTPVKGFENILVKYSSEKSSQKIECMGMVTINGLEELYVGFKHEGMLTNQKNVIDIRSSYMENIQLVFNLDGSLTHLTSLAEFKFGNSNILSNRLKYSIEANGGEVENSFNLDDFKLYVSAAHSGSITNYNNHINLQLNNDKYQFQSRLRVNDDIDGFLDIELPLWLQSYRKLQVSFNQKSDRETQDNKLIIKSSLFDDIQFILNKERYINNIASTIEARLGNAHVIRNQISCKVAAGNMDIDNKFNYNVFGRVYNIYGTVKHTGPWYNSNSNIMMQVNDRVYETHSELSTLPNLNALFEVKTPFDEMHVSLRNKLRNNGRKFVSNVVTRLNDKEINGKMAYTVKNPFDVNVDAEITTPFTEVRLMKLSYEHDLSKTAWDMKGNLILNNDRIIIKSTGTLEPSVDITASIKTPFKEYREFSVNSKVEHTADMLKVDTSILCGHGKTIASHIYADRSSSPAQLNIRVTSPYTNYEEMSLSAEYYGKQRNHDTTISLMKSDMTPITLRGKMNYQSPLVMDSSIDVTTGLENFNNLGISIKNNDQRGIYSSNVMVRWNDNDKIVFDGSCYPVKTWGRNALKSHIQLNTPFEVLKSFTLKAQHDCTARDKSGNMLVEYNGQDMVDVKGQYSFNDVHHANIVVNKPHPMSLQINGMAKERLVDGEVSINWNTNNPDSNVLLQSTLKNKNELRMRAVTSGQTVGLNGVWDSKQNIHSSNAQIAVNDVSAGYAYAWKNQNGLETYMAKAVTPWRSLQLDSDIQMSTTQNKYSTVFHWDADRDETKRVGAKMVVGSKDASNKLGIELELPSIGKDVKVETDLTLNNGRTILDGTTEFTYSKNSNKLKVFSRVEDLSRRYGQNYSFTLGIQHPATSIDIELSGTAGKSNDKYSASMDLQYLTAMRQRKNIALRGEIDQVKRMLDLEMVSPVKEIKLQGQVNTENPYGISFTSVEDKRRIMKGDLSINTEKRTVKLTSNYDPENVNKVLEINGRYGSKNIMAELSRLDGQYRTVDSLMSLTLNSSHLVHSRFHWRPSILNDFKAYGLDKLRRSSRDIQMVLAEISNGIRQEAVQKYEVVAQHIINELRPVLALWKDVLEAMSTMEIRVRSMYWANNMQLRSYTHDNLFLAKDLLLYYKDLKAQMEQVQTEIDNIEETRKEIAHLISAKISTASQNVRQAAQNTMNDAINTFVNTMDMLISESEFVTKQLRLTYNTIKQHFDEMEYNLKNHPLMDTVNEKYQDFMNKLPNAPNITVPEKYSSMIYSANDMLNEVMNRHGLGHIHTAGNEVYQQGKWAWNYWNVPENAKNLLRSVEKEAEKGVRVAAEKLAKQIAFDIQQSRIIVFNPEQGEIQMELYTPVALKSFDSLPKVNIQAKWNKVKSYFPSNNISFWDTYYNYIPPSNLKDLLPPFRGVAGISDDRHFFTFDGSHYDFAGRCSYVLTKDVNGRFTIIANYDRSRNIESIQVMSDDNIVELRQNGRIKINNRRTEIPSSIGKIEVRRLGEVIRITVDKNVQVDYDMLHNYYFFTVSGWYHGRIGGLLGSFDNEHYNDMMTNNNRIAQNIEEFATSWEVAARCSSTRNFAPQVSATEDVEQKCREFFEENNSVFRPCFGQVSPRHFMHTCTNELMSGSGDMCKTAAIYVKMCKNREVNIKIPRQCVQCQNPYGKRFIEGENVTLQRKEGAVPAIDVLFVVEEKMCNVKSLNKIDNIAKEISTSFQNKGMKDIKFGMLGYDIYDVYMHTVNGELFTTANKFAPDFKNLGGAYDTRGGEMNALMKAARYPFRTGAKKIIILKPCTGCREEKYSYETIKKILNDNDITMHLMTPLSFQINGMDGPKTKYIYGVGNNKVYSVQDKTGTPEYFDKVGMRDDVCINLAKKSSGSIFNSMRLVQGRLQTQNDFINSFVSSVVDGNTRAPECQNCRCVHNGNGAGISECQRCSLVEYNFIPEMKNTTT